MSTDPFVQFKAIQREAWATFTVNENFTTPPAAELVRFAHVAAGEQVLDVGCGTGVVALTAARAGARVRGLDLTPALLERAREHAATARVEIDFQEGDAEALPYPDASFDVVLSQFGHIFAPRPEVVTSEMLRVLRPGGRIAFSSWPPEHTMGRMFALLGSMMSPPPGAPAPAPVPQWGAPKIVAERLGDAVTDLLFERGVMTIPSLSPRHSLAFFEANFGLILKVKEMLAGQPERMEALRGQLLTIVEESFAMNQLRQHFLMARGVKRASTTL